MNLPPALSHRADSSPRMPVHAEMIGLPLDSPELMTLRSVYRFVHHRVGESDYFESIQYGISFQTCRGFVDSVYFCSGVDPAFAAFRGPLPMGLSFAMNRAEIHERLGRPDRGLDVHYIERWDLVMCALGIQFTPGDEHVRYLMLEARHLYLDA